MSWLSEFLHGKVSTPAPAPAPATSGSSLKDFFMGSLGDLFDRGIAAVRKTEVGQAVETTATQQAVKDFVTSPVFILGAGAVVLYLILRR